MKSRKVKVKLFFNSNLIVFYILIALLTFLFSVESYFNNTLNYNNTILVYFILCIILNLGNFIYRKYFEYYQ